MEMVGQRDVYNNFNLRLLNSGKDIWTKLLRFVYVYVSGGGGDSSDCDLSDKV